MKKQKISECYSNQKGVTLTVLVVTIIVLIILSGIAVLSVVGENGIINRAQIAAQKQKHKSVEEKICSDIVYDKGEGKVDFSATIVNINKNKSNYELAIKSITPSVITDNTNQIVIEFEDGYKISINSNGNVTVDYKSDSDEVIADEDLIYMKNEYENKSVEDILLSFEPIIMKNELVTYVAFTNDGKIIVKYNDKYFAASLGFDEDSDDEMPYISLIENYVYIADKNDYFLIEVNGNDAIIIGLTEYGREDLSTNKSVLIPTTITGTDEKQYTVTKLGDGAFRDNTDLQSIEFASGIQLDEIGSNVFNGCTNLSRITVPRTVEILGFDAFRESGIKGIEFENGSLLKMIDDQAFLYCQSLTEPITIPKNVKSIGFDAFYGSGITKIEFESGSLLETIDDQAFIDCKNLSATITIPKNVKRIGWGCFQDSSIPGLAFENGCVLEEIGTQTFNNCTSLTGTVRIPKNVKKIGWGAFQQTAITGLEFESGSLLEEIGIQAFNGCTNLTGILIIPKNVKVIEDNCFYENKITGLQFESGSKLETIKSQAFLDCTNLTGKLTIPKSVKVLEANVFRNNKLTEFEIESGSQLEKIESQILCECEYLSGTIVIPETIQVIEQGAFNFPLESTVIIKINKTKTEIENIEGFPWWTNHTILDKDGQQVYPNN